MVVWKVYDINRGRDLAVYTTKALALLHVERVCEDDEYNEYDEYDFEIMGLIVQDSVSDDLDTLTMDEATL